MDQSYQLNICIENGVPTGQIFGLEKEIVFDPRIILCDLRYDKDLFLSLQENDFLFDDFDYEYEYAFNPEQPFLVDKRDQYVAVVTAIMSIIKESYSTQSGIDFYKVELLKSYFDITFQFTASNRVVNPLAHLNEMAPVLGVDFSHLSAKNAPEHLELDMHYSHYSVKKALSYDIAKYHNYFYDCHSISDLVYAILHFLTFGKYKFSRCPHCGRYFATNTYKQKFCYRGSIYPGYEHCSCEQAVRNILQDLRRKRVRINNNLSLNYHSMYEKFFITSEKEIENVRTNPSVVNIAKAYDYINPNKHYTKRKKRK